MYFHDNSKNKNRKIDFSFDSAHCTTFMRIGAKLRGGEGRSAYPYLGFGDFFSGLVNIWYRAKCISPHKIETKLYFKMFLPIKHSLIIIICGFISFFYSLAIYHVCLRFQNKFKETLTATLVPLHPCHYSEASHGVRYDLDFSGNLSKWVARRTLPN